MRALFSLSLVTPSIGLTLIQCHSRCASAIAKTPEYRQSRCDSKKVEMLFAHLKRILKLDRFRLRGLTGANDESILAATAQNLRRPANPAGERPISCNGPSWGNCENDSIERRLNRTRRQ